MVLSWIASSRSAGSSMSVASDANIAATFVPTSVLSSSVRSDTGTWAINGPSISSPCDSRYFRSAPAHTASTTSFTFTSNTFFSSRTSSSGTLV